MQATLPDTPGIEKMTGQESGHVMGDLTELEGAAVNGSADTTREVASVESQDKPAKSAPQSPARSKTPSVHRSPSLVSQLSICHNQGFFRIGKLIFLCERPCTLFII